MTDNPYQAPAVGHSAPMPAARPTLATVLNAYALWMGICSVSAIPSFIIAMGIVEYSHKAIAMICGILLFAVAMTAFDLRFLKGRARRNPALRRTLFIGFTARIVASALFPIGMMVDIWTGLASVAIVSSLSGVVSPTSQRMSLDSFLATTVTTILQGLLMNAILFAFMIVIYCVVILLGVPVRLGEIDGSQEPDHSTSET